MLSENAFSGWRAFIDEQVLPIANSDGAFKSVYVNRGQHEIRLVYAPLWPKVGAVVSLATFLLLGFWLIRLQKPVLWPNRP